MQVQTDFTNGEQVHFEQEDQDVSELIEETYEPTVPLMKQKFTDSDNED